MSQDPAMIALQLSPTFIPGLNKAADLLRAAYPEASDGELLERIFVTGICTTVDQAPRKNNVMLHITQCPDSRMWYSERVGQTVPYLGYWSEGFRSRDNGGFINIVKFADASIIEVPA